MHHRFRTIFIAAITVLPAATAAQAEPPRNAAVLGRVVDADGKPVVGATVELVRSADDTLPGWLHNFIPIDVRIDLRVQ